LTFTRILLNRGVARGRSGSLGAVLRGWRIDSAALVADPTAADLVISALRELVLPYRPDQIVGIERGGTPLAASLSASAASDRPLPALRYLPSGAQRWPDFPPEGRIVLLDDVVNTGRTAAHAIRRVDALDAQVVALACLVQYPKRRPLLLRSWPGPIISLAHLTDLGLPHPVHIRTPRPFTDSNRRPQR
jgi:orotate phosphoribosyltransferase